MSLLTPTEASERANEPTGAMCEAAEWRKLAYERQAEVERLQRVILRYLGGE